MLTGAILERQTVSGLLVHGFNAILLQRQENAAKGEATDISAMIEKLHAAIKDTLGYDYPVISMMDAWEVWLEANRPVKTWIGCRDRAAMFAAAQ